jgi:Protein of unknown function (DUF4238)
MSTRAHTVPKFYLRGFVAPESETSKDPFVWVGALDTGKVYQRSPKNLSICRGLYDGPGGLADRSQSLEKHLSKIEAAASSSIRKFCATAPDSGSHPPAEIWRFLAWQAARTPGWLEVVEESINTLEPTKPYDMVEPPPDGFPEASLSDRSYLVEHPETRVREEVKDTKELNEYRSRGWRWVLAKDDKLELMHVQAWYFQVRHFPRLNWIRLDTPAEDWFVTSDRGVTWTAQGVVNTPPAALRDETAQLVAPLTRNTTLFGGNQKAPLGVNPREVNAFIASTASSWIAGPTESVVRQALADRTTALLH